ncbi:MAG: hypothetical protein FJX77_05820 [Armatimonadetes bacterium]|nr:hypothetical protein [Armatimonadota bacterium]
MLEVTIVSGLFVVLLLGITAMMTTTGWMHVRTELRSDAGTAASIALQHLTADAREANDITLVESYQIRIYYPVTDTNGHYNRFSTDTSRYIEYVRATANGTPSASGSYLWRKDESGAGRTLCENLTDFSAIRPTTKELQVTVEVTRTHGGFSSQSRLSQRVIYLRNPSI